jgi:predicted O-methyltransferase YrrM
MLTEEHSLPAIDISANYSQNASMKRTNFSIGKTFFFVLQILLLTIWMTKQSHTQDLKDNTLDEKVKKFLNIHSRQWYDMNVPAEDGQLLNDLIVKNNYKNALEIGTSTGHSSIWIAWALSKTGGKLITIEIDESRYNSALNNFKIAGVSQYIDARLADAHDLVKKLPGPFDFVFSDADKEWYKNYFIAIDPKLKVGGCFTAHNVSGRGRGFGNRTQIFYQYIKSLPNYETTVNNEGNGLSISYKKAEK